MDMASTKEQMLSPIAPMSTGTAGETPLGARGHATAMPVRGWEWRSLLPPWSLLAAPSGVSPSHCFQPWAGVSHPPWAEQGWIERGQDGDTSTLVTS